MKALTNSDLLLFIDSVVHTRFTYFFCYLLYTDFKLWIIGKSNRIWEEEEEVGICITVINRWDDMRLNCSLFPMIFSLIFNLLLYLRHNLTQVGLATRILSLRPSLSQTICSCAPHTLISSLIAFIQIFFGLTHPQFPSTLSSPILLTIYV